jgi:hypothetical protein
MRKLIVVMALAAVASLAHATDINQSQLIGKWTGRIERPGLGGGRRMAQIGTAEFLLEHRFVCRFASPDQQPLTEQGTWSLLKGQLSITTDDANGKKVKRKARVVPISHQPLEMRLPVKSGAWFLVLRPNQTSQ